MNLPTIAFPKNEYGITTPLRYPGGKSSMSGLFKGTLSKISFNRAITYVEPYAGGAGSAVSLLLNNIVNYIVINDYDRAVYAFWYSILNSTDAFVELMDDTEISIKEWKKQKATYKSKNKEDILSLGFAFFYLNRTNRSGVLSGGVIGGLDQSGDDKIDARYNKDALIGKIEKIAKLKDRIIISNENGLKVFQKYSRSMNSFIYLDPPYVAQGKKLYYNAFDENGHRRLANVVNSRSNAKWVLTYDDVSSIRRLYSEREQFLYDLRYSVNGNRYAKELLICSDSIKDIISSYEISATV